MTNISYTGVKEEDLFDRRFVFDVYTMTTKNINPFSLERKIFDVKDCKMINMFWEQSNKPSFYKRICKPPNFLYLNGKNVTYPKVAQLRIRMRIMKTRKKLQTNKNKKMEEKKQKRKEWRWQGAEANKKKRKN